MPKKSNTRRSDGRICVRVYLGKKDGKKLYKSVYGKTQKEAEQKAEVLRAKLRHGIEISADKDSFSVWADHWLTMKNTEVSDDQYKLICARVDYFVNLIGNAKINEIKIYDLQQILNALALCNPSTGKPTAKNTLRAYLQILTAIFEYAVDNRVLDINPAAKVKLPKDAPTKHRHALSEEERKWVIEFEHRAQPAAMIMMFSGLRRGELTALRWSDIDLEKKTILVSRSYNFKQSEFKTPKNGKSRIVSIPQILVDYLKALPRTSVFVITSSQGKMMTDTAWKRLFDSYMYCLNLQYGTFSVDHVKFEPKQIPMTIREFTPHDLRHTFCTIMYEAGIDVLVAKEQMGHSDVKTTLGIYTHLDAVHKEKSMDKLDALFSKQASNETYIESRG